MAAQFIFRSQNKLPFSLRTVIYPGIEIKRIKENDVAVFELIDANNSSDLIVELVVKRKSSASTAATTTEKTGVPPPSQQPGASSVQQSAATPDSSAATPSVKATLPADAAAAPSAKATLPTHPPTPATMNKSKEWNQRFQELVEFQRKHGHTHVSPKEHPELAIWVAQHAIPSSSQLHTKETKKKVTPNNQKTKKQQVVGANNLIGTPKTKNNEWNDRYTELIQYKRQHGNCLVRKATASTVYPKLIAWVYQQRNSLQKGELSSERIQKLNDIGFHWDAKESMWNFHYALLMMYKRQHGHVKVPQSHFVPQKEGPPINLGNWAQTQRQDFKHGKISPERVAKLNEIGFVWGIRDKCGWMPRYRDLIEYRNEFGHCNVPQQYKGNKALGPWVDKQRQKFKKGLMCEKHRDLLNNIGFEWVRAKTPNRDYSQRKGQVKEEENMEGDVDDEEEEEEPSDDEEEEEGRGGNDDDAHHDPNELDDHHDAIRHSYPNDVHLPPFY